MAHPATRSLFPESGMLGSITGGEFACLINLRFYSDIFRSMKVRIGVRFEFDTLASACDQYFLVVSLCYPCESAVVETLRELPGQPLRFHC